MQNCLLEFMERFENFFLSGLCWILLGLGYSKLNAGAGGLSH